MTVHTEGASRNLLFPGQLLEELHEGGDGFDHLVAAGFVFGQRAAVGVADFLVGGAGHELAEKVNVARNRIEVELDHRAVALGHAQDNRRFVDELAGQRATGVVSNVDADFFKGGDGVFRNVITRARGVSGVTPTLLGEISSL